MPLFLQASVQSADGVTDTIQIFKEGFIGFFLPVDGGMPFITERYGDESDDVDTPLRASEHRVQFWTVDPTNRDDVDEQVLSRLREMKTGSSRRYQLRHLRGGVLYWCGWVLPRFTTDALHEGKQFVTVTARDRLLSLHRQTYTRATEDVALSKVFSVGITELLGDTGLSMPFDEESLWNADGHAGDSLDLRYSTTRFFEQVALETRYQTGPDLRASRLDQYDSQTVLSALARTFGLSIVQYDGAWKGSYANAHLDAVTTVRRYDTAGALVSTTTPDNVVALPAFLQRRTTHGASLDPLRELRSTYSYGANQVGTLKNGNFLLWTAADTDQAEDWTYTTASFFTRAPALQGPATDGPDAWLGPFSLKVKGAQSSADPDSDAHAAACVEFASQAIGQFTAGTSDLRITFWHGLDPATYAGIADAFRLYYRMKFVDGTATTYWQTYASGWKTDAAATEAEKRIRCKGGQDTAGDPNFVLSKIAQREVRTLNTLPGTGTGTLSVELGQPVGPDIVPSTFVGSGLGFALYDGVRLDRGDENSDGADATTFAVRNSNVTDGLDEGELLLLGTGPFTFAAGAILEPDGVTVAGDFKRRAAASAVAHAQLYGQEMLRSKAQERQTIRFTSNGAVPGLSPTKAISYKDARFWPAMVEITRPRCHTTVFAKELKDDASATATTTEQDSGGAIVAGAGAGIIVEEGGLIANLVQSALTVTAAEIAAGVQTTMTITPLSEVVWRDNKPIYLIDRITHELYTLTANGDQGTSATVTFDSFNFAHAVAVGSYLFSDLGDALARIVVAENAITLSVEAGSLCTLNEDISSPTVRTSITCTALAFDVADNDEFWLLDNTEDSSSTKYKLVANGAQSAGATTFTFDSISIRGLTGAAIVPDAAFLGSRIQLNANEIDLRVTKVNADARDGQLVARLNGAQSGTVTSITVEFAGHDAGSGTAFELEVGEIIKVVSASSGDVTQYLRVTAAEPAGSTAIAVADASDVTATNVVLLSFPDESNVYLFQGLPDVVTTGINIKLGSIEMDADLILFKTNAVLSNDRTSPDWLIDIDGFQVKAAPSYDDRNAFSIFEGSTERLRLWHDTSVNETFFQSTQGLTISGVDGVLLDSDVLIGGVGNTHDITIRGSIISITSAGVGVADLDIAAGTKKVHITSSTDFAVDTDTLFVDESTDRVGINDATPSFSLDVNGTARVTGAVQLDTTLAVAGIATFQDDIILDADSNVGLIKLGEDQDWTFGFDENNDRCLSTCGKDAATYEWFGNDGASVQKQLLKLEPDPSSVDGAYVFLAIADAAPGDSRFFNNSYAIYHNSSNEIFIKYKDDLGTTRILNLGTAT